VSANRTRGVGKDAIGVVSRLGKIVKERVREFAEEADEQLRGTLETAREDLDSELATRRKRVESDEPPQDPPAPEDPKT